MTTVSGIQVLLPIKPPGTAKSRLAGVLDASQRSGLATAMAQDVIAQLVLHPLVTRINLLSDHPGAATLARVPKVRLVSENLLLQRDDGLAANPSAAVPEASDRARPDRSRPDRSRPDRSRPDHNLNALLAAACRQLVQEHPVDDSLILVLHADLPLLTAADIDAAVDCYREQQGMVVATDSAGTGTNLLLFSPGLEPRFCFGPGSREAHVRWAQKRNLPVQVLCRPGLALDIDTSDDLDCLLQMAPASVGEYTRHWLTAAGFVQQPRTNTFTLRNAR
ncbi:2-phospho-L-lactate guanylyltransferase [Kineobactrum sediminis]|uniref:3-phospho-D-glycerate guanylyltransferase n=1 Tax=Kineobactrum sediminis TaxID=1905677 RepID=A0A2N5Y453_9GAMM|nr:2-phospho-L-lactate guanylyltransferase [Kineobactrum sediminis]PLW83147.1 2-phospho-L-lactate guanylyltransferase [Kineobactrum sediminis]